MKYDIFLSYRREGGFETAKHLYDLLSRDGYCVSFDIDTLGSGQFNKALFERIDDCQDFILILDRDAFKRTLDPSFPAENDWLRQELAFALKKEKNVIPIMLRGFQWPDNLPTDISDVTFRNGPIYDQSYFDAFYTRLKSFLHSSPSKGRHNIRVSIISAILAIIAGLFAWLYFGNTPPRRSSSFKYDDNGFSLNIKGLSLQQCSALKDILNNMIYIEDGIFEMGRTPGQNRRLTILDSLSVPPHKVALSGFYISRIEVTQAQWDAFMPSTISAKNQGLNFPVDYISWEEAKAFTDTLARITGLSFSLPTEAQWEYAARGGEDFLFSGSDDIKEVGWVLSAQYQQTPHLGQALHSNAFNLYDMSGNVDEWCLDYYGPYEQNNTVNPRGPESGASRVFRGGSINTPKFEAKVSSRHHFVQNYKRDNTGLRIVINQ